MAISLVQYAVADTQSGGTSPCTVTLSSAPSQGSLLLAFVSVKNGAGTTNPFTAPSGWTVDQSNDFNTDGSTFSEWLITAYKVAGASEPTSYDFASSAGLGLGAMVLEYSGVDSSVFDAASVISSGTSSTPSVTGITTGTNGAEVVAGFGVAGGGATFTVPSPLTLVDQENAAGIATNYVVGNNNYASAGATGNFAFSAGVYVAYGGVVVALKPSSTSPALSGTVDVALTRGLSASVSTVLSGTGDMTSGRLAGLLASQSYTAPSGSWIGTASVARSRAMGISVSYAQGGNNTAGVAESRSLSASYLYDAVGAENIAFGRGLSVSLIYGPSGDSSISSHRGMTAGFSYAVSTSLSATSTRARALALALAYSPAVLAESLRSRALSAASVYSPVVSATIARARAFLASTRPGIFASTAIARARSLLGSARYFVPGGLDQAALHSNRGLTASAIYETPSFSVDVYVWAVAGDPPATESNLYLNVNEWGARLFVYAGFDLSGASGLVLELIRPDTSIISVRPSLQTAGTTTSGGESWGGNQYVLYVTEQGDLDQVGTWGARIIYSDAVQSIPTDIGSFNVGP